MPYYLRRNLIMVILKGDFFYTMGKTIDYWKDNLIHCSRHFG